MATKKKTPPNGVEFHNSGYITLYIEDVAYELRPLRVGELAEVLELNADRVVDAVKSAGELEKLKANDRTEKAVRDSAQTMRINAKDYVGFLNRVSDKELPAGDDLPIWIVGPDFFAKALAHWQKIPLVLGA